MEDNPVNIPLADNDGSACSAGILKELFRSLWPKSFVYFFNDEHNSVLNGEV